MLYTTHVVHVYGLSMFTQYLDILFVNSLYLNLFDIFIITIFYISVWSVIKITTFRVKFIYFLLFLFISSVWGFIFSLDGFVFLLLMSEFLILLLFLITAISFNFSNKTSILPNFLFFVIYFILLFIYWTVAPQAMSTFAIMYHHIYNYSLDIVSTDLFLFFWGFFIEQPVVIFYITMMLSLFSMFFIWSYFTIKHISQKSATKFKTVELLRKQQPQKQTLSKAQVRIFKK